MIISGLRTSCAISVESRPSAESRSRSAACCWKRAIEAVSEPKVRDSSRASSSSHGWGAAIRRARSPVAAICFISSVSAASGRVTVRATAQLSSTLTAMAPNAAAATAARSVRSGRSASARERRTTTSGASAPSPSAARAAPYSSPSSSTPAAGAAAQPASSPSCERGSVEANTRGPRTTATWLPVSARSRAANASSSANPSVSRPSTSGGCASIRIGTSTVSRSRPPSTRKAESPAGQLPRVPSETRVRPLRSATTNTSARTRSR